MEIKDKPKSMSIREWITRKIALEIIIPEKTIKLVISHQFDSALEALKSNNSLEISGFGKFFYNKNKAAKEKVRFMSQKDASQKILDSATATEEERRKAELDIAIQSERIVALHKKELNNG